MQEPSDTENNKYCKIDFRSDNNESEEEREIRGRLIGAILHRLALVRREIDVNNLSEDDERYNFNLVTTLKNLIKKFNDKCRIALTPEEVTEIFRTIDASFHKDIIEILFPVLILETQLNLVAEFSFYPTEGDKFHVFD